MANRWERGKLGPYTMPADFSAGGVGLEGINNTKPAVGLKLILPANTVFFANSASLDNNLTYKKLDGSAISRTAFPNIFSVLGTVFGSGDGSTTFNLPDPTNAHPRVLGTPAASGLFQFQASIMGDHKHTAPNFSNTVAGATPVNYNPTGFFTGSPQAWLSVPDGNANPSKRSVRYYGNNPTNNAGGVRMSHEVALNTYITEFDVQLPVGAIVGYIGDDSTSPFGPNYVLCGFGQGSPDLRGRFVTHIGTSNASAIRVPYHTHIESSAASSLYITPMLPSGNYTTRQVPGGGSSQQSNPTYIGLDSTSVGIGPATETRPVNMAINFFMRVR